MEEQDESSKLQMLTGGVDSDLDAVQSLDRRFAEAADVRELVVLTQVRGELIRQDETQKNGRHERRLERTQIVYKLAVAPATIATGVGLLLAGFNTAGLFVVGAGLAAFVPNYVKQVLKIWSREDGNETELE